MFQFGDKAIWEKSEKIANFKHFYFYQPILFEFLNTFKNQRLVASAENIFLI